MGPSVMTFDIILKPYILGQQDFSYYFPIDVSQRSYQYHAGPCWSSPSSIVQQINNMSLND